MKKALCLLGITVFILLLCVSGIAEDQLAPVLIIDEKKAEELYGLALNSYQAGNAQAGLSLATHALILDAEQPQYRFFRAQMAYAVGDYETALQDCNILLAFWGEDETVLAFVNALEAEHSGGPLPDPPVDDDENAEVAFDKSMIFFDEGDMPSAIAALDEALSFSTHNAFLYERRGVAQMELGENLLALTDFSYGLRFSGSSVSLLNACAAALQRLDRYEESRVFLELAIATDPMFAPAYHGRASIYYMQGLYEEALPDSDKSIELAPEQPMFAFARGDVYFYLGRLKEALADYHLAFSLEGSGINHIPMLVEILYASLAEAAQADTYQPPQLGVDILSRFSELQAKAGQGAATDMSPITNAAGVPVYPLANGVELALFSSSPSDSRLFCLLTFDDVEAMAHSDFRQICQSFFKAVSPELTDLEVGAHEYALGLSAENAAGLPEGMTLASYQLNAWQYGRMEYDGKLLLIAFHLPPYPESVASAAHSSVTLDALTDIRTRFIELAKENGLPSLSDTESVLDTSEEDLPILWRELVPGMQWGERFDLAKSSFFSHQLTLFADSAEFSHANQWVQVMIQAVDETLSQKEAAEIYQTLLDTQSPISGHMASSTEMNGKMYILAIEKERIMFYIVHSYPDEFASSHDQ